MCGIVGVHTTTLGQKEKIVLETLITVSNLRGYQGAGIAVRSQKGEYDAHRVIGNGVSLYTSARYRELLDKKGDSSINTVIAHTRWPTKGGVELPFVHPHEKGNVIGVHNGTLTSVNNRWVKPGESDSSLMYDLINDKGIDTAVNESDGAYCLIWMDKEKNELNFIRNKERPLYLAHLGHKIAEDDNVKPYTIFWASEKIFLEFALLRSGYDAKNYYLEELPENTLVTYDLTKKGSIEPKEVREIKKKFVSRSSFWDSDYEYSGWYKNVASQYKESSSTSGKAYGSTTAAVTAKPKEHPWRLWPKLGPGIERGEGVDHGICIASHVERYPAADVSIYVVTYADGSMSRSNMPPTHWAAIKGAANSNDGSRDLVPVTVGPKEVQVHSVKSAEDSAQVFQEIADDALPFNEDVDPGEDADEMIFEKDGTDLFWEAMEKANKKNKKVPPEVAPIQETSRGHYVTAREFEQLILQGCSYCSNNAVNPKKVIWHKPKEYLCEECALDDEARALCSLHPLGIH